MASSLIAGAVAGGVCDIALHPIDTLKTRLQSSLRFKRGMFTGLYNGVGAVALGSAPASGVFFLVYDEIKASKLMPASPLGYAAAAGIADTVACVIRVPFEVIKQRSQASSRATSSLSIMKGLIRAEGARSLFSGFEATVMRDVPFSFIQFPIYETLKGPDDCPSLLAAFYGGVSGGIAAGFTCPLDVLKTRRMLGEKVTISSIARTEGIRSLFKGVVPRVAFISLGGLVWFGAFEKTKYLLNTQSSID